MGTIAKLCSNNSKADPDWLMSWCLLLWNPAYGSLEKIIHHVGTITVLWRCWVPSYSISKLVSLLHRENNFPCSILEIPETAFSEQKTVPALSHMEVGDARRRKRIQERVTVQQPISLHAVVIKVVLTHMQPDLHKSANCRACQDHLPGRFREKHNRPDPVETCLFPISTFTAPGPCLQWNQCQWTPDGWWWWVTSSKYWSGQSFL